MPTTVPAYAAPSASRAARVAPPSSAATSGRTTSSSTIRYAGICHSDIHTVRGDWGPEPYPSRRATRSSASSPRSAPR